MFRSGLAPHLPGDALKTAILACALIASWCPVLAQDSTWKKSLEDALKQAYPLTKLDNGLFAGNTSLKNTGIVLTASQAGIPATDGGGLFERISIVRNGKITNPQGRTGPGAYVCNVGDPLYVRDIKVDDDKIEVKLVTVDPISSTYKGTTRAQRYYAIVHYEFDPGYLPTATVPDLVKAIGAVLATPDQATASK